MARIAVGTFQHETNTFAPSKADRAAFERGGGWPSMVRGAAIPPAFAGMNVPIAGFISAATAAGHSLVPLICANATPSAEVSDEIFEIVMDAMCTDLAKALPVDAVYLDLHGAMVTDSLEDGEGEIVARVRKVVGPRVPVVVSLDLHANVTRAMIDLVDACVAYRTYPHVDMAETGGRAFGLLDRLLKSGSRLAGAFRQMPYIIPITAQCTLIEPGVGLYRRLAEIETRTGVVLSYCTGFPAADIRDCAPSVFGYGPDKAGIEAAVGELARAVEDAEKDYVAELYTPEDAIKRAVARGGRNGKPVVLADTQDNPGAGGNGDTTGLLAAMLRLRPQGAVLGMLIDPKAAKFAHEVGVGNTAEMRIGAISGWPGVEPVTGPFKVLRTGDGQFLCTGPFYGGSRMKLGPMALVEANGVRVVLSSHKVQTADQEMFRHLGVEPVRERIVAVKSSVHFRADFQPIAEEVLVVATPGPNPADPAALTWKRLRLGIRLRPHGPVFKGAAA
ncbi:MAG: M81 family metallopeptidase [Rhodospirillales bacterium]|nr:M81 family metallopeptidase [Rhodospirillales bacterium]